MERGTVYYKLACAVRVCVCVGGGLVAGVNVELVNRSKGPVIVECVGLFTRLMHVLYM